MVLCNISVLSCLHHQADPQRLPADRHPHPTSSPEALHPSSVFCCTVLMASAGLLTKNVSSLECSTLHVLDLLCGLNHSSFGRTYVCHVGFRCSILAIQRPCLHHGGCCHSVTLRSRQVVAPFSRTCSEFNRLAAIHLLAMSPVEQNSVATQDRESFFMSFITKSWSSAKVILVPRVTTTTLSSVCSSTLGAASSRHGASSAQNHSCDSQQLHRVISATNVEMVEVLCRKLTQANCECLQP